MNIFFGVMTAVPVALKLAGAVDWSWTLVLAPIVCPLIMLGVMYLMAWVFTDKQGNARVNAKRPMRCPLRKSMTDTKQS